MGAISIRSARPGDAPEWERMRQALWPSEPGEHRREIAAYFAAKGWAEAGSVRGEAVAYRGVGAPNEVEVLVAVADDGQVIGFAEAGIRPYAEGCLSGRVAYLEGLFVKPAWRGRGVAAALVAAVEAWGRAQGCTELASDAELGNDASIAMHRALGFEEVERIVCFRKGL